MRINKSKMRHVKDRGGRATRAPRCFFMLSVRYVLAAGLWAAMALALWLAAFFGTIQLPTRFDTLS